MNLPPAHLQEPRWKTGICHQCPPPPSYLRGSGWNPHAALELAAGSLVIKGSCAGAKQATSEGQLANPQGVVWEASPR